MAQSVTIRVVAPRVGRVLAATGRRVLVVPSPGPPGSTGPEGPPGQFDPDQIAALVGSAAYQGLSHVQAAPAATWTVPHTLGRHPAAVTVVVAGEQVYPDIAFPDPQTVVVTFAAPTSGRAEII